MTRVPLKPWLWPLLPPVLVALASALLPLLVLWRWYGRGSATWPEVLLSLGGAALGTLIPVLAPLLTVLFVLRARARRDGVLRPRLTALWGLCLGVGGSVLLYALGLLFGLSPTAFAPLPLLLALFLALPVVGYLLGRWLGTRPTKN
ncbi:hypothetical protein [Deinococcus aestuarii]|uniref:hypothetical protein n=1 Tax=Deinococcus aestuarii TaxID=2774531 RepID=UPI001C0BDF61|nr:hypothetical protein [Deinococcus aestuarii]